MKLKTSFSVAAAIGLVLVSAGVSAGEISCGSSHRQELSGTGSAGSFRYTQEIFFGRELKRTPADTGVEIQLSRALVRGPVPLGTSFEGVPQKGSESLLAVMEVIGKNFTQNNRTFYNRVRIKGDGNLALKSGSEVKLGRFSSEVDAYLEIQKAKVRLFESTYREAGYRIIESKIPALSIAGSQGFSIILSLPAGVKYSATFPGGSGSDSETSETVGATCSKVEVKAF